MTTAAERSRNFLFGIELLNDLCNPDRTPGVPEAVRERAKGVLRHFPSAEDLRATILAAGLPSALSPEMFDLEMLRAAPLRQKSPDIGASRS